MARRSSSLNNTDSGIAREIGTQYAVVKYVADNLDIIIAASAGGIITLPELIEGTSTEARYVTAAVLDDWLDSYAFASISYVNTGLSGKVDKVTGKVLSDNNYSTAEKDKLAGLESSRFKGEFVSLAALQTAFPTAEVGAYANVDAGIGQDVIRYVWDTNDTDWIEQLGVSTQLTGAEVKSLYESQPDTNAFTDAEKTKLSVAAPLASPTFTGVTTLVSNLVFSGTSRRIVGDFNNATLSSRTLVQSASGTNTSLGIIPFSTSGNAELVLYTSNNPAISTLGSLTVSASAVTLAVGITGGASYLPLILSNNGANKIVIPPTGNITMSVGLDITGNISASNLNISNWDTAYTQRNQWDGGSATLNAVNGRTSLGASDVGSSFFTTANPNAIRFPRVNADNTVTYLDATGFKTAISAGSGTVTSVSMTVPTGLTVTGGPITGSGTFAVTLTAGFSIPTTTNQTNWTTAYTQTRQWDGGDTGLVAATGRTSLGVSARSLNSDVTTTTYNLASGDDNNYLRFTNASPKTVTVRPNATHALPTDGVFYLRNSGAGNLTVVAGSGVTINPPQGGTLVAAQHATLALRKVGTDEFDLMGQVIPS